MIAFLSVARTIMPEETVGYIANTRQFAAVLFVIMVEGEPYCLLLTNKETKVTFLPCDDITGKILNTRGDPLGSHDIIEDWSGSISSMLRIESTDIKEPKKFEFSSFILPDDLGRHSKHFEAIEIPLHIHYTVFVVEIKARPEGKSIVTWANIASVAIGQECTDICNVERKILEEYLRLRREQAVT